MISAKPAKTLICLLINRRFHKLEFMVATGQRLAETDEEIAAGQKDVIKFIYDLILSRYVKINHDVSAQDGVKRFFKLKRRKQVKIPECHVVSQSIRNRIFAAAQGNEVSLEPIVREFSQFFSCVYSFPGSEKSFIGNVGGQDGAVPVFCICS